MKNDIFHTLQSDYRYALICVKELQKAIFDEESGLITSDPNSFDKKKLDWKYRINLTGFESGLTRMEKLLNDRLNELKGNK